MWIRTAAVAAVAAFAAISSAFYVESPALPPTYNVKELLRHTDLLTGQRMLRNRGLTECIPVFEEFSGDSDMTSVIGRSEG